MSAALIAPLAAITGADVFGLVISALVLHLPHLRAAARGEALDVRGLASDRHLRRRPGRLIKPVGIYMSRVFTNQRVFLSPSSGRSSASPTRCCA